MADSTRASLKARPWLILGSQLHSPPPLEVHDGENEFALGETCDTLIHIRCSA